MRLWLRLMLILAVAAATGVGVCVFALQGTLHRQWMCYRAGAAADYQEAKRCFRWFETGSDRQARLGELVGKWGTGNQQFDWFLARYMSEPESSEAIRERFSLEFGWRENVLQRWAHYWTWQAEPDPDREIASILTYLDTLALTDPPRAISWREILDLQAIFCLTGESQLASRLKPTNWQQRYSQWQKLQSSPYPSIPKPAAPLNSWQGPVPQ